MSATGTLGHIEEFGGNNEDWPQYVERLEHFFAANSIEDEGKKRAVFLSVVGAATYKTLRNIVSPAKPGDKTYAALVEALSKHFNPKPSEIVERFKFHSRVRKPGESVATYVAELRALTEFCNFGDTLEVMIRDRLVCGINDTVLQKRLLAESELTYTKAVEMAINFETASQSVRELRVKPEGGAMPQQSVHKTSATPTDGDADAVLTCFRCGKRGHKVPQCRLRKDVVCHRCGKQGHLQRVCKTKSKSNQHTNQRKSQCKTQTVGQVQHGEEEEESGSEADSTLCQVQSPGETSSPPLMVKVKVDNCVVNMEVDTGVSHSLMSESTFRGLWPGRSLHPTPIRLQSYSKKPIPVLGCVKVNID